MAGLSSNVCACNASKSGRWRWYDRYFAYSMAVGMQDYEQEIAACKRRLFSELFQSDIQALLEVGMGTGPNLKYYGQQKVCPSPEMTAVWHCIRFWYTRCHMPYTCCPGRKHVVICACDWSHCKSDGWSRHRDAAACHELSTLFCALHTIAWQCPQWVHARQYKCANPADIVVLQVPV